MKKIIIGIVALSSFSAFAETSAVISDPTHKETKLPLSLNSDSNGVCKYLGFEKAVTGSVIKGTYVISKMKVFSVVFSDGSPTDVDYRSASRSTKTAAIRLSSDGQIVDQENSKVIGTITCVRE